MTPPRTKRWRLKEVPDAAAESALTTDRCPLSLARVLAQRGIRDPKEAARFFRPRIEQLHDPLSMADMLKAEARIEHALGAGERIMVYGD